MMCQNTTVCVHFLSLLICFTYSSLEHLIEEYGVRKTEVVRWLIYQHFLNDISLTSLTLYICNPYSKSHSVYFKTWTWTIRNTSSSSFDRLGPVDCSNFRIYPKTTSISILGTVCRTADHPLQGCYSRYIEQCKRSKTYTYIRWISFRCLCSIGCSHSSAYLQQKLLRLCKICYVFMFRHVLDDSFH